MADLPRVRNDQLRQIIRRATDQGWTVEHTAGNHLRFTNPKGSRVIFPSTPSDGRGLKNALSLLRRHGFE